MNETIRLALAARPMALVGASGDPAKYGNVILKFLRARGIATFAVNPRGGEIDGQPAYASLADCPEKPGLAIFVVPPQAGIGLLDGVKMLGLDAVWLQPGAASGALLDRARELGLNPIEACVMVELDNA